MSDENKVFSIRPENRFKLDPNFVVQYINKQPTWGFGLLSYVTYKRTYARRLQPNQLKAEAMYYWGLSEKGAEELIADSKQETEEFWQTCVRVVEGISSVYKQHIRDTGQHWSDVTEQEHAQEMFRRLWAFKFTPPGRGLWGMGTEAMELKGSGMLNNCFSGTTLLPTLECGLVPMQQLENRHVSVFTKQGWRTAVVKSFGQQQVRRVGIKPKIKGAYGFYYEATADHRWPTLNRGDVTDLRVGDELSGVFIGEENVGDNDEYMRGRMHGALFNRNGPTCVVPFAGMPYKYIISKSQYRSLPMFDGVEDAGDDVVYYSNYSVSAVPPSGASSSYIAGFWAGLFDECGEKRPYGTSVHVARKSADATWFITNAVFSAEPVVTMSGSDGAWYLLRPTDDVTFQVEEISDTGRTTTVYCPQVPVEHAFALSSGAYTGNCGFVSSEWLDQDFTSPFTRLMDFLMLGVGMGFDVLGAGKVRLSEPVVDHEAHLIEDTREGWIEALRRTLAAFVNEGTLPVRWDYSSIRPEGAPLKTFGGTASGHGPLKRLLDTVRSLCYSYVDRYVDTAFIADVMNLIGVCVVAGNVRRSSEIALGSPHDETFLTLKNDDRARELRDELEEIAAEIPGYFEARGTIALVKAEMRKYSVLSQEYAEKRQVLAGLEDELRRLLNSNALYVVKEQELWALPVKAYRWASNNTVLCDLGDANYDKLAEHTIRNGEPGYGWPEIYQAYGRLKDAPNYKDKKAKGFNPCLPAGTRILTRSGYVAIETVVGQQLDVWNGEHWAPVTPKITGHDQPLVRVELSDGTSLTCTTYHKWFLAPERTGLASTVVRAEELQPGDTLAKFEMPIVEHGDDWDNAYTHGFFCGDGQINANSGSRGALLYGEKRALVSKLATTSVSAEDTYGRVYVGLPRSLPEKNVVPHNLSVKSRLAWLAGLLDADGCVLRNPHSLCLQLSSIDKAFLAEVRLMLTTLGVQAKITLEREGGLRALPNGKGGRTDYECKPCYRLLINATDTHRLVSLGMFTHRLDLPLVKPVRSARRFVTVEAVEKVGMADTVYCFEEPITHRGTFEGIVTGQCGEQTLHDGELCCLCETYPTRHESLEDFLDTLKYAYRYAKGVTLIPTHDKKTNAVMVRNRRIGTSMAGIIEMYSKLGLAECKRWWDAGYKTICEWDTEYSSWLGVNESIKKTSIKPGGSTPLLVGVEGGMKLPNSRYYMRTIRIDHISPLVTALKDAGFRVEKDRTTPRTIVAYFPCKAPDGVRLGKEMSLWEQAAIFTALQSEWSDNMVSATLTFQQHEQEDVARVLKVYEGQWKAVSFLPFDDHGYDQAPYIPCTEEEYIDAVRAIKPVQLDGSIIRHEEDEKYCSGSVCERPVDAESDASVIAS